jgi:hypothetical protein
LEERNLAPFPQRLPPDRTVLFQESIRYNSVARLLVWVFITNVFLFVLGGFFRLSQDVGLMIFSVLFILAPILIFGFFMKKFVSHQKLQDCFEIYQHGGMFFAYQFEDGKSRRREFSSLELLQVLDRTPNDDTCYFVLRFFDDAGIAIEDWSGNWDWARMEKTLGLKSGAKK